MNRAGTAEALAGERLPLASGTKCINNDLKYPLQIFGFAPAAGFTYIAMSRLTLPHRQQWLHALTEFIGRFPHEATRFFALLTSSSMRCIAWRVIAHYYLRTSACTYISRGVIFYFPLLNVVGDEKGLSIFKLDLNFRIQIQPIFTLDFNEAYRANRS